MFLQEFRAQYLLELDATMLMTQLLAASFLGASLALAPIAAGQRLVVSSRPKLLEVYAAPGDPYASPVSFLRDGEVIACTRISDMAGQLWAEHLVDERRRGLYLGDAPAEAEYFGWSCIALRGKCWLEPTQLELTVAGGRPVSTVLTAPFGNR